MTKPRRLPSPWSYSETPGGFVVTDATGQALAYTYAEADPARRLTAGKLSPDEARRVAANIAKLPELIGRAERIDAGGADRDSTTSFQSATAETVPETSR